MKFAVFSVSRAQTLAHLQYRNIELLSNLFFLFWMLNAQNEVCRNKTKHRKRNKLWASARKNKHFLMNAARGEIQVYTILSISNVTNYNRCLCVSKSICNVRACCLVLICSWPSNTISLLNNLNQRNKHCQSHTCALHFQKTYLERLTIPTYN